MTFDAPPPIAPLEQKLEPIAPPLGDVTASGFKWTLALSIVSRALSFVSSIVLAHLLLKADNGAYVQAFITISMVAAIRDGPLIPVLMARQKQFNELQSDAFWLSQVLGFFGGAIIATVGGFSWMHSNDHTVANLLWINAIASPLMAVGTVSSIKIQIQMRFALNAKIFALNYLATTLFTLLLAAPPFKWGAYALMVPQVVMAVVRSAYFVWLEPPKVIRFLSLNTIRELIFAGSIIAYSGLTIQVLGQGDNFIISRFYNKETVGLYGWAFNLSVQAILVLAASLGSVLLAALARLNDEPTRQMAGFLRIIRTMAVIGIPFCTLQILFAQPIIKPLFSVEWTGAEPLVRILSFGMAFAIVNGFCTQLMLARKQHRLLIIWSTISVIAFMVLVYFGVRIGGVHGVAWGVAVYHAIVGTIGLRMVVGKYGNFADIAAAFWPPLLAATAAAIPILSMPWLMPTIYRGDAQLPITLISIALFASVFLAVYAVMIRSLSPEAWQEIVQRINAVTRRFGVPLS